MNFIDIDENEINVVRGAAPYKERTGGVARHSLRYILGDLRDIKDKYFQLGFHLNEFVSNEYYKDFGYDSMKDFCVANIPIDYSSLSRCMTVHSFSCERIPGSEWLLTNRMEEKYKKYSYSQLVEMIGMDRVLEAECTPEMTVREMRELKKRKKKNNVQSEEKEDKKRKKKNNVQPEEKEKESCDVATDNAQEVNCDESIKEFDKMKQFETLVGYPGEFVSNMFRNKFGDDLPVYVRGKMLDIDIPGYCVTIRISFTAIEENEESEG